MKVKARISLMVAVLLSLYSCVERPDAGQFSAPEFGEVTVKVDEYKASLSCTVLNVRDGEAFGFRYGKQGGTLTKLSVVPENGLITAEINGLDAADYVVEAFASSGKNELSSNPKSFSVTESGPATVIPDAVFNRYCLANFDRNGDGRISSEEAQLVTKIEVCTDSIFSVRGIEFFPNLLELHARGGMVPGEWIRKGQLMSLDVSQNTYLRILDCEDNQLRQLDLSHNSELVELRAAWNYLNAIDVTMLPKLTYFNVDINEGITSVDVTNNPKLREYLGNGLSLSGVPDLTNCHSLQGLHFSGAGGAKYIDKPDFFSQWPELILINTSQYPLDEIDLSSNKKVESIWAADMPEMEIFDLSPLANLHSIYVNNCPKLKKILVNDNVDIGSLYVEREGTKELDIRHLPKEPYIEFPDKELEKYLLSKYDEDADGYISYKEGAHVTEIELSATKVSSLDGLEYFEKLEKLVVNDPESKKGLLMTVDLSRNNNLRIINLGGNKNLNTLVLPEKGGILEELVCCDSRLTYLDISRFVNLKLLEWDDSKISSVDITHNRELRKYGGNNIPLSSAPDLTQNTKLTDIHICSNGGAEFIDKDFFCRWPGIRSFNMGCYPGEEINLSLNTEMQDVWAPALVKVKVLDLSASPHLRFLSINYSESLETVIVNDMVDISKLNLEREGNVKAVIRHKSEMNQ